MLFFKRKQTTDDILPPPPPDMDLELEQGLQAKPKFFDETAEPEKTQPFPEEPEFTELIDALEGKNQAKVLIKRDTTIGKKHAKKNKVQSNEINQLKKRIEKIELNKMQLKKSDSKKKNTIKTSSKKQKPVIGSKKNRKNKELKITEEIKTQGVYDNPQYYSGKPDFVYPTNDLSKVSGNDFEKPKEILEAEEEIISAIEKIKNKEKKPFLRNLFSKKQETAGEKAAREIPMPISVGSVSFIQSKINEVRQLLMSIDLDGARAGYIEIMECYKNLKPEEKAKVYHDIRELYFERKNAEGPKMPS